LGAPIAISWESCLIFKAFERSPEELKAQSGEKQSNSGENLGTGAIAPLRLRWFHHMPRRDRRGVLRRSRENNSSAEQASKGVGSEQERPGGPIIRGE
jgi:hypothetical protein